MLNVGVCYFGCFFFVLGIYFNVFQGVVWNGNNIGGFFKCGVGIVMYVGFGNLGGIIFVYFFLIKDCFCYYFGFGIFFVCQVMVVILFIFMIIYLCWENVCCDCEYKFLSEYIEEERVVEREKGDNVSFFCYII